MRSPARPQAQPLHPLRNLKPIPLRRSVWTWFREPAELVGGVVLVLAAVYLWRVLPW